MMSQTIKTICIITMISFCTISYGQQFDVNISEEVEIQLGYNPLKAVKNIDGSYVVYATAPPRFGRKYLDILTYPGLSKKEGNVEIKVPFKKTYSYEFLQNAKKLVRIIVQKDKEERKIKKYFQEFDAKGQPIGVIEYDNTSYGEYNDLPKVLTRYSEDSKMALIYDDYDENEKKVNFKGGFTIVDSELKVVHKYEYNSKESQKMNEMAYFNIENDGDFSFLLKKYKSTKAKEVIKEGKIKVPGYDYFLGIKNKDSALEEIKIDLDNSFVRGGVFTRNNDGDFVLFFPYDSDSKNNTAIGFYSIHIDIETLEITKNKHTFSEDEIENFGTWKKSKPGLDEKFYLSPMIAQDETKIAFAMERINRKKIQAGFSVEHMSIVCFSLNNDGEYLNYLHVPKCYSEINALNMAHIKYFNGQLYVIYNDNHKNMEREVSAYGKMKSSWKRTNDYLYYAYEEEGTLKRMRISESLNSGFMNAGSPLIEKDKMIIPYLDIGGDDKVIKIISLTEKSKI